MIFDNCKPGDIVTYTLGGTNSCYTSIIVSLDYDREEHTVIDIASSNSDYLVPQAYVFNTTSDDLTELEIVGHIDLLAPVKGQFPELFL